MKKLTSFVLYLILTLCPVMAQGFRLSGQITDTSGEPVPGATVMITGTDIGTMADADGKFILDVKSGLSPEATLTLSSLGFKDLVVLVGKKTVFNVTLEEENNVLEETVVIGYSTVKKKDLTGSLTSVEGDAVRTRQTATVSEALQGAMPGVTVTRSSSAPGGEATIRVRGITSMTSGATDPYVLIDGVPGGDQRCQPWRYRECRVSIHLRFAGSRRSHPHHNKKGEGEWQGKRVLQLQPWRGLSDQDA